MQNDFLWVLHSMINDHLNRNEGLAELKSLHSKTPILSVTY